MVFGSGLMGRMLGGSMAVGVTAGASPEDDSGDFSPEGLADDGALSDGAGTPSLFEQMGLGAYMAPDLPGGEDGGPSGAQAGPATAGDMARLSEADRPDADEALLVLRPDDLVAEASVETAGAEPPDMAFDPDEDQLVIVFDDSDGAAEPLLDLRQSESDPEMTDLYVDDAFVLSLPSADVPEPGSIVLVGESAAASLGVA